MSIKWPHSEWVKRRKRLMKKMGSDAVAILPTAPVRLRNGNVQFAYRPDSDFIYLTNFSEPDAVAVLVPDRPEGEFLLFVRPRDETRERWDGLRAGPLGACSQFGAQQAFTMDELDDVLPAILESRSRVFYTLGLNPDFDQRVVGWVNTLRAQVKNGSHPPLEFVALDHPLHELRLIKSETEIKAMQASAQLAANAHQRAMRAAKPLMYEYELAAEFYHEFQRHNATMAYEPIVGAGPNACVLHYRDNKDQLHDGDLVLIDAGCELEYYASDITRTFPVNGRFTKPQAALYDVVLSAQKAAIDQCKVGCAWNDPHDAAVRVITEGLVELGFLEGSIAELVETQAYRPWFMHKTGHWLGLDVHDVGEYKKGQKWRSFEVGMTLTVEPGLYVSENDVTVPKAFRGIGIRIEDDVLIREEGPLVLTAGVVKERADIEALMAQGG